MVSIITTRDKLEEDKNIQKEIINQIIELSKRITDSDLEQIRIIIGVQQVNRYDGEYY